VHSALAVHSGLKVGLNPACKGRAPVVDLDSKAYKMVAQYDMLCPRGAPSLVRCTKLKVKGAVRFAGPNVRIEGDFAVTNGDAEVKTLSPKRYTGELDVTDWDDDTADECTVFSCSIM
jgi:hypothetical protein